MKNKNISTNLSRRVFISSLVATVTILMPSSIFACDSGDFGKEAKSIFSKYFKKTFRYVLGIPEKKSGDKIGYNAKTKIITFKGTPYTIPEFREYRKLQSMKTINKNKLKENLKKFKIEKNIALGVRG